MVDSNVSWVTLMTSEGFSASESATTKDARATTEAAETNDEKRIVELQEKEWMRKKGQAVSRPFMDWLETPAYVSHSLLTSQHARRNSLTFRYCPGLIPW